MTDYKLDMVELTKRLNDVNNKHVTGEYDDKTTRHLHLDNLSLARDAVVVMLVDDWLRRHDLK